MVATCWGVAAEDAERGVGGTGEGPGRVVPFGEQHVRLAPRRQHRHVLGADVEILGGKRQPDAEGVVGVEVDLPGIPAELARRHRREAGGAGEAGRRKSRVRLGGGAVVAAVDVELAVGVDADLDAHHRVAEAGAQVAPLVDDRVRGVGIDLDVVHPVEDAGDVEHRAEHVLGLEAVGGVAGGELPGREVGAGPQARQRDAHRVPGPAPLARRALEQHSRGVVAVDVADAADHPGIELAEVVGADGGGVDPVVAGRQDDGDAAQLDVLVGARVELAAAAADAVAGRVGAARVAEAAEVGPFVLVEAAVQASLHLHLLADLGVEQQLDLGALAGVAVALSGNGGEVVQRAVDVLVAPQPLGIGGAADHQLPARRTRRRQQQERQEARGKALS
jgi:hypothetical protein